MKKAILKYSSLLAIFSAPFFSTQTYAVECLDVNTPGENIDPCTIGAVQTNKTFDLIGNISPGSGNVGIEFMNGPNTLNFTGDIGSDEADRPLFLFNSTDNNVLNIDKLTYAANLNSLMSVKNAAKYLDIDFNEEEKFKVYPWWASVYPWDNRTFDDKLKYYPGEVKKNRLSNGMEILSDNPHEIMDNLLENSLFSHAKQYTQLVEEIKNNGYKYDEDYNHISAEIFVHNGKFCWKVGLDGNHRIAVLAALGYETIPVHITKIIRLEELNYWPNVKLSYFNEKQAANIFHNIFDAKPSAIHDKWIKKVG